MHKTSMLFESKFHLEQNFKLCTILCNLRIIVFWKYIIVQSSIYINYNNTKLWEKWYVKSERNDM